MSITLFAALSIPDHVAERLLPLQKGVPGAKWRPRENLHLTLRYFGEVAEPVAEEIDASLSALADRFTPFDVQLKAAGAFGAGDPHTLWIGVAANEALNKLAADCERAARRVGLKPEPRKFTPHVTLAYLSGTELSRVQAFETRLGLFQAPQFRADSMTLFSSWTRKSAPNLYRSEAEYPFRA
ncbi:MAG: RNA 2',3'-cyclic phosphodiesterase [Terricaulis silvestris]